MTLTIKTSLKVISTFVLNGVLNSANAQSGDGINFDFDHDFDLTGGGVLSNFLNNTEQFNAVLDHGCWCAKLDPNHPKHLGGGNGIDELDDVCKEWFETRKCNDHFPGGSCFNVADEHSEFQAMIDASRLPTMAVCNNVDANDSTRTFSDCEVDTCKIDMFYAFIIQLIMSEDSGTIPTVADPGTCVRSPRPAGRDKICTGFAPHMRLEKGVLPTTMPDTTVIPTTEAPTTTTEVATTVAPTPGPQTEPTLESVTEACLTSVFDLTIVMDGSGSISPRAFRNAIDFLEDFVDPLNISPTNTRVTIAQFSNDYEVYTTFGDDEINVSDALDVLRASQMKKITATELALSETLETITTFGRPDVRQIVMFVTDGESTNGLDIVDAVTGTSVNTAQAMHDANVLMFAVGVGSATDLTELELIATDPDSEHLYQVNGFNALQNIKHKIGRAMCDAGNASGLGSSRSYTDLPKGGHRIVYGQSEGFDMEREHSTHNRK